MTVHVRLAGDPAEAWSVLAALTVLITAGVVAWAVARHVRGVEADRRDALIDMIDDLKFERDEARADRAALCAQSARRTDVSIRQYQHCRELIDQAAAMRAELDEARAENARLRGEHASDDGEGGAS